MFKFIPKQLDQHIENGFDVLQTENGQRRVYGDSFKSFTIKLDKADTPLDIVESYCTEQVYKCNLTTAEYLRNKKAIDRPFSEHFRSNYNFQKVSAGVYFYQVIVPSTD